MKKGQFVYKVIQFFYNELKNNRVGVINEKIANKWRLSIQPTPDFSMY